MYSKTYIISGYGLNFECLNSISDEDMAKFIRKHINLHDYQTKLSDKDLLEDFRFYEDCISSEEGLFGVISSAISRETGVRIEYHSYCGQEAVFLCKCLPWMYNESESKLTPDGIEELFKPYLEELGIPDAELEDIEIEYYD